MENLIKEYSLPDHLYLTFNNIKSKSLKLYSNRVELNDNSVILFDNIDSVSFTATHPFFISELFAFIKFFNITPDECDIDDIVFYIKAQDKHEDSVKYVFSIFSDIEKAFLKERNPEA